MTLPDTILRADMIAWLRLMAAHYAGLREAYAARDERDYATAAGGGATALKEAADALERGNPWEPVGSQEPTPPDLPFGVDDVVQQAGGERGKVLGIHVLTEQEAERQSEQYGITRKPGVYASVHLWGIPTKDGATGRIGHAVIPVGDLVKVEGE